ncbi:Helicase, C-terminal domain and DNA/RNA helicase, DEAD/DEAH box type, N-terminal domain and Helicase, superfamily 1/2, ATP-binding domain and RNA helicase, DEAD-box type, Q motif domain and P-loop containing nucleoside triphosphate hydrolase domain-containing protein [Strongyloides ratti]|uniref:RNA helicase n=1 Tax=Strongyloides ratti TaxID=34506 RepID=A0A090MS70_STRRB|nr:Helicase, C-terminal domain and DNA/RNA helicase, DEAD/DEAH box type, N-terminal domain and Helicase, superfamily 1/2, ATP-binding domain and RNA helicase, DEAD-box type, Q motif domain and P-loop containing nucleoside triphosphate hydrolase domain-containing protein [Strongyloides ratti]CEF61098.1 Helicase, C-terminal domain and DNA/RNA helicase, DEAD/DEAH box type, N-terminal domain and Helicase, superfamily 1/2, ATP-binding domain and RNA helicase, DEAD-box type, Q motif domain and P-loop co
MFPRIFHQTIRDFAVNSVFKLFSSNTSRILTFTSANSLKYNHTDIFHRQPLGDQKTEFQIHINKNMRVSRENKFSSSNYEGDRGYRNGMSGSSRNINRYQSSRNAPPSGSFGRPSNGNNYNKRDNTQSDSPSKLQDVDWSRYQLQPIQKNFYKEASAVTEREQYEIDEWIANNQVTLQGKNIPKPVFGFDELPIDEPLLDLLNKCYQKPTVIQSISWPIAMSGRDIISIARTGSGKTLGFILPAINHIRNQPKRGHGDGPGALVLLPTRELAQQVEDVSRDYCNATNMKMCCLFGGTSKGGQARDLQRGVDIIVATPGRLIDFLLTETTNLRRCSFLVLDEADRMLDMGFEPQIRKIIGQIRPDRQTMMFSATWPKEVRNMASEFQKDPAFLNVGSLELSANHNITQHIEIIEEHEKQPRMLQLLDGILKTAEPKTLIFVETKRKADELTRSMRREGWPAMCIHGDKGQSERDWVLRQFKEGKTPILLATDVAARGLDVNDIKYVINFDYPNNSEDYVHRIGRTGRSDRKGDAYTFFTPGNAGKARDLIKILEEAKQKVPQALYSFAESSSHGGNGRGNKRPYGGNGGGYSKRMRYNNW